MRLAIRLMRAECLRQAKLYSRKPALMLHPLLFFVLVIILFPLGLSPDPSVLHKVAPGLVWVAALLSMLLGLDSVFQSDFETGVLEQIVLQAAPLPYCVFVKLICFWAFSVFPLIILTPLIGGMLYLSIHEIGILTLALILGTPVICTLGAILSALTVGIGRQTALMPLLLLPLTIPLIIFGTGSVLMLEQSGPSGSILLILFALCLVSVCLGPFVIAAALRLLDH